MGDRAEAGRAGDGRLDRLRARPWTGESEPGDAATGVPTMLTAEERQLYRWLGAHWATGVGAIVDLGCFAGGSTARLAAGAAQAGHGAPIHAYDRFTADPATRARLLPDHPPQCAGARDILPLARDFLQPWADRVTLHRGAIEALGWTGVAGGGGPIELLVIDAAKTDAVADAIAAAFFPALIPGASLVVHQDALHWRQPWIVAQMARLADIFTPLLHVERDTVVWRCERAPCAETLASARLTECDDAALDTALAEAERSLAPLGIAARVAGLRRALDGNPATRAAHAMQGPPGALGF